MRPPSPSPYFQLRHSTSWFDRFGKKASLVCLLLAIALLMGWNNRSDAQDSPESDSSHTAPTAEKNPSKAEQEGADALSSAADNGNNHNLAKLIPDQKVYSGSPPTILDLDVVFKNSAIDEGGPIRVEVIHNKKKKVVKAAVEGNRLVLSWGKTGKSEIRLRATNVQTGKYLDSQFNIQVWEADFALLVMTAIGGLGIFLLGMKNMSEGLQAVAGSSLRRMISIATKNRFIATIMGLSVTTLIQSSSITTVMVVGFVNSGFMTLQQAIGVIMGANIGTTITGWIIALKIGKYGLPLLGVGAFFYLFSRRDRVRYLAMGVMGLGMVFLGLELMKNGFSMIKEMPDFEAWFAAFDAHTYLGVLKCAAVGCILTFLVQSSSATLGITVSLASIGVIPFETAAALVMGENVGTTITAWLASFGTTTNAKRAAYFHVIFNLVGVIWITSIFIPFYLPFIIWIVELPSLSNMLGGIDPETGQMVNVAAAIALTHTLFNVTNTLLFLPFTTFFASLLRRIIPEKPHKEKPHLTSLDIRMLETPVIGIEQSRVEVLRMADGCNKMMGWLGTALEANDPDPKLVQKIFHREEVLDTIQDEVVHFISNLLSANLPHTVIDEGRRQLRMVDELESISDYITSILKFRLKLRNQGLQLDPQRHQELMRLHEMTSDYVKLITDAYEMRNTDILTKAVSAGKEFNKHVKELQSKHLLKLTDETIDPRMNASYTSSLNSYRRVRDHTLNVAEAIGGEK